MFKGTYEGGKGGGGRRWIQKAVSKMKRKGTLGSFGKATAKKIARAKKQGGIMKKKAIFAENVKK